MTPASFLPLQSVLRPCPKPPSRVCRPEDVPNAPSPFIPKSKIPDNTKVGLTLAINGQLKQSGVTDLMIFDVPKLISFVSGIMKLEEGDIILTGTPAGVGPVVAGDNVEVKLTYPGLEGEVVSEYALKAEDRNGGYEFKA